MAKQLTLDEAEQYSRQALASQPVEVRRRRYDEGLTFRVTVAGKTLPEISVPATTGLVDSDQLDAAILSVRDSLAG